MRPVGIRYPRTAREAAPVQRLLKPLRSEHLSVPVMRLRHAVRVHEKAVAGIQMERPVGIPGFLGDAQENVVPVDLPNQRPRGRIQIRIIKEPPQKINTQDTVRMPPVPEKQQEKIP